MSYEFPRGSRKAVNPYTWLVCAKIVKFGRGEGDPTPGSMFSAEHEPTQTDPWDRRRGSAQPTGPYEVDIAIFNAVEACQPTGLKLVKPLRSYSVVSSGKRVRKSALQLALPLRYSSV